MGGSQPGAGDLSHPRASYMSSKLFQLLTYHTEPTQCGWAHKASDNVVTYAHAVPFYYPWLWDLDKFHNIFTPSSFFCVVRINIRHSTQSPRGVNSLGCQVTLRIFFFFLL
jgi:hypothetical protein